MRVFQSRSMSFEFGRIFWQPFGREPGRALGQRGARGLGFGDRAVIENNRGRLARCRRFGAIDFIKPLQQGDDIGAARGRARFRQ